MSELLEYKCPCCDGAIRFDPNIQKMKCPYCDSEFELETLQQYDEILQGEEEHEMVWQQTPSDQWLANEQDHLNVYVCESCGGEIIGDDTLGATSCPYCGNPVVMTGKFKGSLRPDYVIPFHKDKNDAKEIYKKHLKGKKFLPDNFKDENHIDEIKGIYVPFWLFETDVTANIRYKGTVVRTWSDSKYDYTETNYFTMVRGGNVGFEHIPVDGSLKMADDLMESIEPFNFNEAVDFQTAYLAGYLANKYDVGIEESIERANERVKKSTEEVFLNTCMGYSSIVSEHSDIQLQNGITKYALYPVWLLNTTYQGTQYTFAMNGQTGKFVGDLPIDKAKFWKYFFIYFLGSTIVVFILCFLVYTFLF